MRAPAPRNLRPTLPQRAGLACFSSMLAMVKDNAHMIDVHQVSTVVEQSNEVGDQERRGFIQELLSQVGMLRVAWGGGWFNTDFGSALAVHLGSHGRRLRFTVRLFRLTQNRNCPIHARPRCCLRKESRT